MNPSDTFRFLLALGLLPLVLRLARGIRIPKGRTAFVIGVVSIVFAFGMQAVGGLVPWSEFRLLRHFVFGLGGFCLAWAAWQARVHELQQVSGGRR